MRLIQKFSFLFSFLHFIPCAFITAKGLVSIKKSNRATVEKFKRLFARRAWKFHRHKQFPETVRDVGWKRGEEERKGKRRERSEELETSFFAARDFRRCLSHKQPSRHPPLGGKMPPPPHPLESTPILLSSPLFVNSWHASPRYAKIKRHAGYSIVRNRGNEFR